MTIEIHSKCLWQHPATSNHLAWTKIEWSEMSDPIVITAQSLRQLRPGNWKIPIKPRTEELTKLLSAAQEFTKFPHFKNTHHLTRHLVREPKRHCQSSVSSVLSRQQAQSPRKQTTTKSIQWSRWASFNVLFWHFFGVTSSIPAPLKKLSTSF